VGFYSECARNTLGHTPEFKQKFFWICNDCGESYRVVPHLFTSNKQKGCSYCSGNKANETNCLATHYPHLVEEWHPSNNKTPYEVTPGSHYSARWLCKTCGHDWEVPVYNRTGNNSKGCSKCNRGGWLLKKVGYEDSLAAKYPEVAKQWDYEKNTGTPEERRSGSGFVE